MKEDKVDKNVTWVGEKINAIWFWRKSERTKPRVGTSDTWLDLDKVNCKGFVCVFEDNILALPLRTKLYGFVMKIINFSRFIKAGNLLTNW